MAKDPAFLFYPGDWQGGTMYMTHEQKGCYMDLLILQFHVGKFSLAQAKQVLSICFDLAWPMLQQKFSTDGVLYWNERLHVEIEKRKNFTKSRRDNAKGKNSTKASAEHMLQHMENENENRIRDDTSLGKSENLFFPDVKFEEAFDNASMDGFKMTFPDHNIENELLIFKLKVRGSPGKYIHRDSGGLRSAFTYQLSHKNGNRNNTKAATRSTDAIIEQNKSFGVRKGGGF